MKSVSPRDCALAVALPLTEERFLGDLRSAEHDYASFVCEPYRTEGVEDGYYWSVVYRRFAEAMEKRCREVQRRGVAVVRDATPADLRSLFDRHAVVTMVSHWRFCALQPEEIVDAEALMTALSNPPNAVVAAFRSALGDSWPPDRAQDRTALADALNVVLAAGHAAYAEAGRIPVMELKIPEVRLNRLTLENAFAGAIAAGRCVEFGDGMRTAGEFVDCVPLLFDGLLDLTICNSAVLGHQVKEQRRRCVVAVSRHPVEPFIRLARYRLIIDALAKKPRPYGELL